MPDSHKILSVFVDSSDVSTINAFHHLGNIQRQAWDAIGKKVRSEFPPSMVLMDPINGVFQDAQQRKMLAQCLHCRDGFTEDVAERFREIVLEAYSQVLGTEVTCVDGDATARHPAATFRR